MASDVRRILSMFLVCLLLATGASAQDVLVPKASPNTVDAHPCTQSTLSTIFRCIGHDLRGVTDADARRWLIVGGILAAGSLLLDDEVVHKFADVDQDPSVAIGENLGEAGLQFGVPFAVYLAARATGHDTAADMGIVMLRTQVVNGILTRGLKMLPRPRPYQKVATPTKGSFPSGHTSATFATATVAYRRWGWRVGVPAYALASFVGATRLQNVHYLSDVAFGAALGVASGLVVDLPGRRPVVAPLIAPGVAGVSITIGGN